jgi:hypothetical protein
MAMTLDGSNGVTFNDASLQGAAASPFGLKNRIINGDMRIDQRNAGASVTPVDDQYITDRFQYVSTQTSKFTSQQSSTAPASFINSLLFTSSSAYSVLSGDFFLVRQKIEGFNTADLNWGTANAKTVTLSFWVRSSLTGTFGGSLFNSSGNRSYPFTFTVSTANTFEYKTITVAGDTSGTWLTTNASGIQVGFGLGVGSTYSGTAGAWAGTLYFSATGATSVVSTNGATFYITGVQLEQNTSATPFERRLYNQELANCQRYYYQPIQSTSSGTAQGGVFTWVITGDTTTAVSNNQFPVTMRASPTVTIYNNGGTSGGVQVGGVGDTTGVSAARINNAGCSAVTKGSSLGSTGNVCIALVVINAEL